MQVTPISFIIVIIRADSRLWKAKVCFKILVCGERHGTDNGCKHLAADIGRAAGNRVAVIHPGSTSGKQPLGRCRPNVLSGKRGADRHAPSASIPTQRH